jgi:hypothetical protein
MMLRVDSQADALAAIYRDAEQRLRAQVERAVASGALGTASYRRAQLTQVQALLAETQARAVPQAAAIVGNGYVQGARIVDNTLPVAGSFGGVHQEAVQVLADSLATKLNGAAVQVGRRVDDIFRREGLRHSALQIATGGTRAETSQQLAKTLTDQGIKAFTDRAGRDWGLENYTSMAVRTTAREAVSEGTKNRLLENGQDQVDIALSATACPECVAAYSDGPFDITAIDLPPLHPRCTCVATPAGTLDQVGQLVDEALA